MERYLTNKLLFETTSHSKFTISNNYFARVCDKIARLYLSGSSTQNAGQING